MRPRRQWRPSARTGLTRAARGRPSGGYSGFAGRDATRAYFDLCFTDECLAYAHCLNTLSESQLKEVQTWVDFYMNEPKYPFVGYVEPDPSDEKVCADAVATLAAKEAAKKEADAAKKAAAANTTE